MLLAGRLLAVLNSIGKGRFTVHKDNEIVSEIDAFELIKKRDFDALIDGIETHPQLTQVRGENGTTILHQAAEVAPSETINRLVELGCDIHALDDNNETPIWWAIDDSNFEVVNYLLKQGADLDVMNKEGIYPIHQMALYNGIEDVDFLLSHGVPIDQKTRYGWTVFHFAAMNADLNLIRFLIERGANINKKDDKGLTPLHVAATSNIMSHQIPKFLQAIELLVESGVDIFSRSREGETAEEMTHSHEISQLLAQYRKNAS